MAKAVWNDVTLAESDQTIIIVRGILERDQG